MSIKTDGIYKDSFGNREIQAGWLNYADDTGSGNDYLAVLDPPVPVYGKGFPISFRAASASSGPCTLNGIAIKKLHDEDLEAGDIEAGQIVRVEHDGTYWQMIGPPASVAARILTLEDRYVKCLWFEQIDSGTSGTITPPAEGTIVLDQWASGVDTLASKVGSGVPTFESPKTSADVVVTATLDVGGNYTLSGTPSAYPIALIYAYRIKLKNLDDSKVMGGIEVISEEVVAETGFFEIDVNGGLMPKTDVTSDEYFELDENGAIMPKSVGA